MENFIGGILVMGYFVAGLFFLRYWKETQDRLFAFFALAFWVLAVQRFALVLANQPHEELTYLYMIRLLGFSLILVAIIDKNRAPSSKG
jgi:hypothetical protein